MSRFSGDKKLYRNRRKGIVGGVCAGLADYFEVDRKLVRILFVVAMFMTLQVALIAYVVAYFALDNDPDTLIDDEGRLRSRFDSNFERKSVLNSVQDRFSKVEDRLRKLEAYVTSKRFKLQDEIDRL